MRIESWFAYDEKRAYVHAALIAGWGVLAGALYILNVEYTIVATVLIAIIYLAFDWQLRGWLIHRAFKGAARKGDARAVDALSAFLVSAVLLARGSTGYRSHPAEEVAMKYVVNQGRYDMFLVRLAREVTRLD